MKKFILGMSYISLITPATVGVFQNSLAYKNIAYSLSVVNAEEDYITKETLTNLENKKIRNIVSTSFNINDDNGNNIPIKEENMFYASKSSSSIWYMKTDVNGNTSHEEIIDFSGVKDVTPALLNIYSRGEYLYIVKPSPEDTSVFKFDTKEYFASGDKEIKKLFYKKVGNEDKFFVGSLDGIESKSITSTDFSFTEELGGGVVGEELYIASNDVNNDFAYYIFNNDSAFFSINENGEVKYIDIESPKLKPFSKIDTIFADNSENTKFIYISNLSSKSSSYLAVKKGDTWNFSENIKVNGKPVTNAINFKNIHNKLYFSNDNTLYTITSDDVDENLNINVTNEVFKTDGDITAISNSVNAFGDETLYITTLEGMYTVHVDNTGEAKNVRKISSERFNQHLVVNVGSKTFSANSEKLDSDIESLTLVQKIINLSDFEKIKNIDVTSAWKEMEKAMKSKFADNPEFEDDEVIQFNITIAFMASLRSYDKEGKKIDIIEEDKSNLTDYNLLTPDEFRDIANINPKDISNELLPNPEKPEPLKDVYRIFADKTLKPEKQSEFFKGEHHINAVIAEETSSDEYKAAQKWIEDINDIDSKGQIIGGTNVENKKLYDLIIEPIKKKYFSSNPNDSELGFDRKYDLIVNDGKDVLFTVEEDEQFVNVSIKPKDKYLPDNLKDFKIDSKVQIINIIKGIDLDKIKKSIEGKEIDAENKLLKTSANNSETEQFLIERIKKRLIDEKVLNQADLANLGIKLEDKNLKASGDSTFEIKIFHVKAPNDGVAVNGKIINLLKDEVDLSLNETSIQIERKSSSILKVNNFERVGSEIEIKDKSRKIDGNEGKTSNFSFSYNHKTGELKITGDKVGEVTVSVKTSNAKQAVDLKVNVTPLKVRLDRGDKDLFLYKLNKKTYNISNYNIVGDIEIFVSNTKDESKTYDAINNEFSKYVDISYDESNGKLTLKAKEGTSEPLYITIKGSEADEDLTFKLEISPLLIPVWAIAVLSTVSGAGVLTPGLYFGIKKIRSSYSSGKKFSTKSSKRSKGFNKDYLFDEETNKDNWSSRNKNKD